LNYNVTLNQVVSAPDGGISAMLFGSALLGLVAMRRRFGN
jgi:MYXO-CTERM domain-containing protein